MSSINLFSLGLLVGLVDVCGTINDFFFDNYVIPFGFHHFLCRQILPRTGPNHLEIAAYLLASSILLPIIDGILLLWICNYYFYGKNISENILESAIICLPIIYGLVEMIYSLRDSDKSWCIGPSQFLIRYIVNTNYQSVVRIAGITIVPLIYTLIMQLLFLS